jgi:Fur family ferric uptake transcriptional regulator
MFTENHRKVAYEMARHNKSYPREEFQVFEEYLIENGLKHSRQREVILERFLAAKGHMTVDDLYRIIQQTHPEIGRTTIYRTLKLLCDAQLAEAIELKDGLTRFEHYKHEHHDHMICTDCGAILEFTSEEIERLQDQIAKAHGFTVESHRHQVFGVCEKCSRRRHPPKKGQSKDRTRRVSYRSSRAEASPTPS